MAVRSKQTTTVSSLTRGQQNQRVVEVSGPDPVQLLPPNGKRIDLLFYNAGAAIIYVGPQNVTVGGVLVPLSAINGIPVVPTGAFGDEHSYAGWWAISAGGALCNVIVTEVLE